MKDAWGLDRYVRGQGFTQDSSVAEIPTSHMDFDGDDFGPLLNTRPCPGPETESSHATPSMLTRQRQYRPEELPVGTVFIKYGVVDSASQQARTKIWLVTSAYSATHFNCIRIKSYGGRGLNGLVADYYEQARATNGELPTTDIDPWVQKQIKGHALLHVEGARPFLPPNEPITTKRALALQLEADVPPAVLPRAARVAFLADTILPYATELAIIGRLTAFSTALVEIYDRHIYDGPPGSVVQGQST
jgi:hypothetical protein